MLLWAPKERSLWYVLSGLLRGGISMQWGSDTSSLSSESRSSLVGMLVRGAVLMIILGELGPSRGGAVAWAGDVLSSSSPDSSNVLTVIPLGLSLSSITGAEKLIEPSGPEEGSLGSLVPGSEWWDKVTSEPQRLVTGDLGIVSGPASLEAWP